MDEGYYDWIGFSLVKGIGATRLKTLIDAFGDIHVAWQAPVEALCAAGLSLRLAEAIRLVRAGDGVEKALRRIEALGVIVLTWDDPAYPRLLKAVDQPPPVLYVRGELLPEDDLAIGVVGTRRVTAYGRQVAVELAGALAHSGVTVVSGLARGVDAAAHQAALDAAGRTLAVLGSGVDTIYPPEHARMAERILGQGALISDYPLGTLPEASNFPPRNRIISGLSRAVVVVEAGESSGALITASFAANQGRDVFAVPGSIYAPQSKGTNRLLLQGAHPLLEVGELLASLRLDQAADQRLVRRVLPGDALEAQLYALLGAEPLHVDEIRARCELPIEKVSSALVMLELKGLVRQVGGMQYVAVREALSEYTT